ncbi:MAG: type II 3-dehydroquinate dehydratase [Gemmatimonadales bacterium]
MRVAVLNGPNLNLLGSREPELYGTERLEDLERTVRERAVELGVEIEWRQTNHEGEFVDLVQSLPATADGAVVNAAAFTHTSLAIRDAFLAVRVPFVEVHLSNIFAREEQRRHSLLADLAVGIVAGFGPRGYVWALETLVQHVERSES